MSGIYINMEMPDRCFACPLFLFDEGEGDCRKTIYGGSALEYRKVDIEIAIDTRPNWCPLVPVQEHGDLIDRDKLEMGFDPYLGCYTDDC